MPDQDDEYAVRGARAGVYFTDRLQQVVLVSPTIVGVASLRGEHDDIMLFEAGVERGLYQAPGLALELLPILVDATDSADDQQMMLQRLGARHREYSQAGEGEGFHISPRQRR